MLNKRITRSVLCSAALLSLLSLSGCLKEENASREGFWDGTPFSFTIDASNGIVEIFVWNVNCKTDTCKASADGVYGGLGFSAESSTVAFTMTVPAGTVEIWGKFDENEGKAQGSYKFVSTCCTEEADWIATLLPEGKPEDIYPEDTVDAGDPDPAGTAIELVNTVREDLGLEPVLRDPKIDSAAAAHAEYFTLHCPQYMSTGLSPHRENPDWTEGFTGVYFWDRMEHFGYTGEPASEIIAFEGKPTWAIDGWLWSLYHRLPMIQPATTAAGYGRTEECCMENARGVDVMDFGKSVGVTLIPVQFPKDGQTDVPVAWNGLESPQPPLPTGYNYPSGPIATLTLPFNKFTVDLHELLDPEGNPIEHQFVSPADDPAELLENVCAVYALEPLEYSTEYTVRIQVTEEGGAPELFEWSFTTEAPELPAE